MAVALTKAGRTRETDPAAAGSALRALDELERLARSEGLTGLLG